MAVTEEPILSRLDRVDNMVRQLEEIRGSSRSYMESASYESTPSSTSSFDHFSTVSLEKNCLPIDRVMLDTEVKGTLVQRIDLLEQRLLKLEGELENEKKRELDNEKSPSPTGIKKKGFKGLVNKMVKGKIIHNFKD